MPAIDGFVIAPKPAAHFGAGAIDKLPGVVRAAGADHVIVVTDAMLAAKPVIAQVTAVLGAAGLPVRVFSGVHPNPRRRGAGQHPAPGYGVRRRRHPGRYRPPALKTSRLRCGRPGMSPRLDAPTRGKLVLCHIRTAR